jgi:hypothetical protein
MHTESQDSERTVSEAVVWETVAPDHHAAAESPTLQMTVTVVASPSKEVAGASTAGCGLGLVVFASVSFSSCCS